MLAGTVVQLGRNTTGRTKALTRDTGTDAGYIASLLMTRENPIAQIGDGILWSLLLREIRPLQSGVGGSTQIEPQADLGVGVRCEHESLACIVKRKSADPDVEVKIAVRMVELWKYLAIPRQNKIRLARSESLSVRLVPQWSSPYISAPLVF